MKLTQTGLQIFEEIKSFCQENGYKAIDIYTLEVLANAFDTFAICSHILSEKGLTQTAKTGFEVVRPEVAIQKTAVETIGKLADKFGLTPASRKKIFGMKKEPEKKRFNHDSRFNLDIKNK